MPNHVHVSHPAIVKRLKRADGHLRSVIAMIEAGEPCLAVAQQLQAVEKAIVNAKRTLVQDHIDNCLDEAVGQVPAANQATIDEFKAISKFL
ncbi:MAG: metal-sensing transcriptional repressor [Rhizobiaceae bacterium]